MIIYVSVNDNGVYKPANIAGGSHLASKHCLLSWPTAAAAAAPPCDVVVSVVR